LCVPRIQPVDPNFLGRDACQRGRAHLGLYHGLVVKLCYALAVVFPVVLYALSCSNVRFCCVHTPGAYVHGSRHRWGALHGGLVVRISSGLTEKACGTRLVCMSTKHARTTLGRSETLASLALYTCSLETTHPLRKAPWLGPSPSSRDDGRAWVSYISSSAGTSSLELSMGYFFHDLRNSPHPLPAVIVSANGPASS
jgi:hypothetical protein